MKKIIFAIIILLSFSSLSQAATCFWVGGSGNYSDATHWSSSNGGGGSTCAGAGGIPSAGDTATVNDHASGLNGGTLTIDQTVNLAVFNCNNLTGTLENSVGNHTFNLTGTAAFTCTGTTTKTINGGTATYNLTGGNASTIWSISSTGLTNPTTAFASSTINLTHVGGAASGIVSFAGVAITYGTINLNAHSPMSGFSILTGPTIGTLNIAAPNAVLFPGAATTTITEAINLTGTSSTARVYFGSSLAGTIATLALSTATSSFAWGIVRAMTVTGGPIVAPNSIDAGLNAASGWTFTPPSTGGGICIGC